MQIKCEKDFHFFNMWLLNI